MAVTLTASKVNRTLSDIDYLTISSALPDAANVGEEVVKR